MIKAEGCDFRYKGVDALAASGIDLEIRKGSFVLLCGRSGSGKTTVTRMLNGLVPHFYEGDYGGRVFVDGMELAETRPYLISEKVGSVFQNPKTQFFNVDTTTEVVFGLENMGASHEEMSKRLEEVSDACGVRGLLGKNVFQLSGGEKQKIAIASACAPDPDVFVFDEPSSSLDPESTAAIGDMMGALKEAGKTIVVAEHRLWYLLDLVDVALYMEDGVITKRFDGDEFRGLGDGEMNALGLRSRDEVVSLTETGTAPTEGGLSAEGLSFKRFGKTVFSDLSLSVGFGEIVAITGKNGCGKTTLAWMLCGIEKTNAGQITVNGMKMSRRQLRKRCSLVMQDINRQFFGYSVLDECLLGSDATEENALCTLESLNLSEFRDRHPMALSGGQKQRLAVATALLSGKDILVLDEPSSGLDYCNMSNLAQAIKKAAEMGKIVIVTTHDHELIRALDARVIDWASACGNA